MPEKKTMEKAKSDLKQGKSASTAAGEFVHEEIEHVREGKHGARSAKQAIDWLVQGTPRRSAAARTEEGSDQRVHAARRKARTGHRPGPALATPHLAQAQSSHTPGARARAQNGGFVGRALAPGEDCGGPAPPANE